MSSAIADILLVEDDFRLADLTKHYFEQNGFSVFIESDGDKALNAFYQYKPKIILLDLMLPNYDGLNICRDLRKVFHGPILILTAKDTVIDQVIGLEAGADDYVIKPADPMVLLSRVRTLLRRASNTSLTNIEAVPNIVFGKLHINTASQQVSLDGNIIALTSQEFELLVLLATHAGAILNRESLFKQIRGIDYDGLDRSIDVSISRLRKKLGDDATNPSKVITVWGKGYLFSPDAWL